jgi:hypothetical protein
MPPKRPLNEVYRAAAELLSKRGFSKHAMARDADGRLTTLEDAVSICGWGALVLASGGHGAREWIELEGPLKEAGLRMPLETWNDLERTTAQDVVGLFRRAATMLETGKSKVGPTGRPRLGPKR